MVANAGSSEQPNLARESIGLNGIDLRAELLDLLNLTGDLRSEGFLEGLRSPMGLRQYSVAATPERAN